MKPSQKPIVLKKAKKTQVEMVREARYTTITPLQTMKLKVRPFYKCITQL